MRSIIAISGDVLKFKPRASGDNSCKPAAGFKSITQVADKPVARLFYFEATYVSLEQTKCKHLRPTHVQGILTDGLRACEHIKCSLEH